MGEMDENMHMRGVHIIDHPVRFGEFAHEDSRVLQTSTDIFATPPQCFHAANLPERRMDEGRLVRSSHCFLPSRPISPMGRSFIPPFEIAESYMGYPFRNRVCIYGPFLGSIIVIPLLVFLSLPPLSQLNCCCCLFVRCFAGLSLFTITTPAGKGTKR